MKRESKKVESKRWSDRLEKMESETDRQIPEMVHMEKESNQWRR